MQIRDRLRSVLTPNVRGDVRHWPRPVERHHGGEIEDARWAQFLDVATHPSRLELEDAARLARCEEGERLRIVERNRVEVNRNAVGRLDPIHRRAQDRQVCQAEEVELEKPERLNAVHLNLGHHPFGVCGALQRHDLRERLATDHHTCGVGGGVAHHTFELFGQVHEWRIVGTFGERLEVGVLARLAKRCAELVWNRLRQAVNIAVALPQDATDITDRGACRHRAEGDDLRHLALAVLLRNVANHLFATTILKVDIDIWHRHAVLVQEAFKREVVVQRINRRDAKRVGHDGAWCAPSAGGGDPLLTCESDEVGHDQEVGAVAHL